MTMNTAIYKAKELLKKHQWRKLLDFLEESKMKSLNELEYLILKCQYPCDQIHLAGVVKII